jgi:hypothetical protein
VHYLSWSKSPWEVRQPAPALVADPPALGGGGVKIASEHDPPPGMEAAVEAAVRFWIHGASPPGPADGAEAEVVGHVVGKDTVGDQPRGVVPEIRPLPPAVSFGACALAVPGGRGSGERLDGAAMARRHQLTFPSWSGHPRRR